MEETLAAPARIVTPRLIQSLSDKEPPAEMKELRRSIEGCIKTMMDEKAETKTDPGLPDEDDVLSDSDHEEEQKEEEESPEPVEQPVPEEENIEQCVPEEELDHEQEVIEQCVPEEEKPVNEEEVVEQSVPEEENNEQASVSTQQSEEVQRQELTEQERQTISEDLSRFLITEVDKAVEGHERPMVIPVLNLAPEPAVVSVEEEEQAEEVFQQAEVVTFSQEELASAWEEFQKHKTIPQIDMRDFVIIYAKSVCEQAIEDEDYDRAERIESDIKELTNMCRVGEEDQTVRIQAQNLESRLQDVKQKQAISEMEWEQRMTDMKQREQAKIDEIEEKQQQEREEFEAKCQTQEFLQRFTKPSPMLLQLWSLQKRLALQHDFEGAKEVKQRADDLQKRETDEAQKRAMRSVQQNYDKLLLKQSKEMECARANSIRKLKQMETERLKDKEVKEKLNRQVESRMREKRPPLKRSCLPPLGANSRDATPFMARRAASRNRNVQIEPQSQALDVKIPSVKAVIGTRPKQPFT